MKLEIGGKKGFFFLIFIITAAGLFIRLRCCLWGYPFELHPDEHTIVENAIDMLARHSWEAYVYNRPDQFEIKIDAVLFSIFSRLRYGLPAEEAFQHSKMAFYVVARAFSSFCGTLMIPLSALCLGYLLPSEQSGKRLAQISVSILVAFSPFFVEHSAYATPDVPLALIICLFAILYCRYFISGDPKLIPLSAIVAGVGFCVKYPAAILCFFIASMCVFESIKRRNVGSFFLWGIKSMVFFLLTVFIIAPNLFTDFPEVLSVIRKEARPEHLGADGLGFWGNLLFYIKTTINMTGYVSIPLFLVGSFEILRSKQMRLFFLVGLVYCLFISGLNLHWERWGSPVYPFYMLAVSVGIGFFPDYLSRVGNKITLPFIGSAAVIVLAVLYANAVLSGLCIVKNTSLEDTRISALKYCENNGISEAETLYERYTAFSMSRTGWDKTSCFSLSSDGISVNAPYQDKRYFMMSNSFLRRFEKEPVRYREELVIYHKIQEEYPLIAEFVPDGEISQKSSAIKNILHAFRYLTSDLHTSGYTIYLFDLQGSRS